MHVGKWRLFHNGLYKEIVLFYIENPPFDIIKQMITLINNSCIKQAHKLQSIVNSKLAK